MHKILNTNHWCDSFHKCNNYKNVLGMHLETQALRSYLIKWIIAIKPLVTDCNFCDIFYIKLHSSLI